MEINHITLIGSGIPERMHGAIIRFYENGIQPGGFLSAVIDNDLAGALGRADDENRHLLYAYVKWFYNHAPSGTWGYAGAVDNYIQRCAHARQEIEEAKQ